LCICSLSLALWSCSGDKRSVDDLSDTARDEETMAMVEELDAISRSGNILEMWHQNEARAHHFEAQAETAAGAADRFSFMFQAAVEWLNAGEYEKSIKLFNSVIEQHESGKFKLNEKSIKQFYELLAVSYLRKGEIENCVHHHDVNSCIMPIQASARHGKKAGSRAAVEIYEKLLSQDPNDLQNIWLYNLAQMTLGHYPDNMEARYLISERYFSSDYQLPRFVDRAAKAGVATNDISGSCVVDDFNNDGLLDIMASSYGLQDQLRLFINTADGQFRDVTASAGLEGITSGLNMIQADYNNDGHLDVFILRGAWLGNAGRHPNSLLHNNGDGTFSDRTRSAGLYYLNPSQTACWADFNNDGHIDLFVGNESSSTASFPSELFLNNGDGSFREAARASGLNVNVFVKGTAAGDIDNDGDMDLLVSNLLGANLLYENTGASGNYSFREIGAASGIAGPNFSFPCWFWDVNNDGLLDVYINSFDVRDFTTASAKVAADYLGHNPGTEYSALYINRGNKKFELATLEYGLDKVLYTMGCNFGDIDNDGFLDFYAATGTPDFRAVFPNRMFRNNEGTAFQDVTTATGTGHIQKGHGVGFGDIDNDGDQDMYVVLGGSYAGDNFMNALFENPGNDRNSWISIELEGQKANRSAIGSRIEVTLEMEDGTIRSLHRTVGSGASFGCNSLRQEIGLGRAKSIRQISVSWQGSGLTEKFEGLKAKSFYHIKEGSGQAELKNVRSYNM